MRKTIKNFMFIKRKETAMMMIAVAIAIIGGVVVFDFFVSMGDGETVQLGMVMALSAYVIFDIICEGITFGQHFTLCLQMGVTRKNFLSSYVVFKVIKNMLALSIIAILGAVERVVSKNLVSKLLRVRFVDNYSQVFSGRALVVTISLAVLLAFLAVFVGAALLRFGRIAFWVLWAFWMIVFLKSLDNISVPAFFHADIWVFVLVWLAISAAIGILLYLITYHCFIKDQSVKA